MMPVHGRSRVAVALLTLTLAWATLGSAGCESQPERCAICYMPVPHDTRTIVSAEGKRSVACDPRCALTFQQQTGHPVELLQVTDFESGSTLDPGSATFVGGSDTAPDAHTEAVRMTPNDAAYLHWHRCLPSVLAFRTREAAERFQREHGGTVVSPADLGFARRG